MFQKFKKWDNWKLYKNIRKVEVILLNNWAKITNTILNHIDVIIVIYVYK